MNSNPTNSTPANGRRYWRSLDELADTPEFKEWLHREFPQGASDELDGQNRRHFLKIMAASFAFAGVATLGGGCRRPEEKLEPFGQQPANYIYGKPDYYATAMPTRTGAVPLIAKSYEGRPIKVEGNALFPGSNGGTDRYAQASILDLYDVDRAKQFKHDGKPVSRDEALSFLADLSKKFAANQGKGLCFLMERNTSPSFKRLRNLIQNKFPLAAWFVHESVDFTVQRLAATLAFDEEAKFVHESWGHTRAIFPRLDKATRILSLDCDFLGGEDDSHRLIGDFAKSRKPEVNGGMSRLYAIESLFTLTGANADHRLRVSASAVLEIAAAVAVEVLNLAAPAGTESAAVLSALQKIPNTTKVDPSWVKSCARDLVEQKGRAIVLAGHRQPVVVHLIAHAMNSVLGAMGQTVELRQTGQSIKERVAELWSLVKFANDGGADTLVILGSNPAYTGAGDLDWTSVQRKVKTVVRLGYYEDETAADCHWHFPATHYLESWGDATTSDGTIVPVQPLIQPLFGGLTELEFLAHLAGEAEASPYDIVRTTFGNSDEGWKKFLFNGFLADGGSSPVAGRFNWERLLQDIKPAPALSANSLEVIFYRDAKMDDGRYANNGWMQELPDPITKMTWDNAVLVSRKTARDLGVQNGDLVEISLNGRSVVGPIWTQPGMADYSLGLALGYGRERAGRVGTGVGFNAYKIFSGKYIETGATVKKTGGTHVLATTQSHWSMEGRPAVREANIGEYEKHQDFAKAMQGHEPPIVASLYPNPLDEAKKTALHQWGMAIDLTSCVGCGTCVLACQSENNIPIVGKDQVLRGREMHWMNIHRYYTADPKKKNNPSIFDFNADENQADVNQQFAEWIDDVQAVNQPMLCQHCEAAPCENVCPVAATVHDQEGLNVMAYNRCIGTRYCSNNCPYKVRRFNYLDFNKRPLADLKGTLYPTPLTHKTDGKWDMLRWWKNPDSGMRDEEEWDLIKMAKNPDVTVRMRGVMEKCTYCTQRIEQAKIAQKVKAGASDDVRLTQAAGNIPKTACQQACPAQAIVFGDVSDPNSDVSKLKDLERNYSVLGNLLTKPRTTYLARIRNPNPLMPDYTEWPYSFEEYENRNGNPFEGDHKHEAVEKGAS